MIACGINVLLGSRGTHFTAVSLGIGLDPCIVASVGRGIFSHGFHFPPFSIKGDQQDRGLIFYVGGRRRAILILITTIAPKRYQRFPVAYHTSAYITLTHQPYVIRINPFPPYKIILTGFGVLPQVLGFPFSPAFRRGPSGLRS